ncbi:TFIIB-type zinc ribbon-containing protein [Goodfellowiella coeruleoviolacea]|uniref:Transcription factor zinc-finger domain-containing protein n=1 Tax=Goodfellowiella coeruleoviolacea TaxID=334858 RepID=A0AAE3GIL5_9PSEU|nr:zf-TFIIB domain-containing protein [Goodfellowiella coeruleoviolacea]MCP2168886.1 hypothetical protein [Goodfellowiella coeruleoviolacea]
MICPKCQNTMRTYDREGVHLEQCESCRGIFLDRGELEQIVAAERAHAERNARYVPPVATPSPAYQSDHGYGHDHQQHGQYRADHQRADHHHYDHHENRRPRSFLEELFD